MSKRKKHSLPETIYAQWSDDAGRTRRGDAKCLLTGDTHKSILDARGLDAGNESGPVGVYKLVRVVKLTSETKTTEIPL